MAITIDKAVQRLQREMGTYVRFDHLYEEFPQMSWEGFQKEVFKLADAGKLVLARHDGPLENKERDYAAHTTIRDDGDDYFIGVARPLS